MANVAEKYLIYSNRVVSELIAPAYYHLATRLITLSKKKFSSSFSGILFYVCSNIFYYIRA